MLNYHTQHPWRSSDNCSRLNVLDITNADSLVITEAAATKSEEVLG